MTKKEQAKQSLKNRIREVLEPIKCGCLDGWCVHLQKIMEAVDKAFSP